MKQIDLDDCRRSIELLPWYANGSIDANGRLTVETHLETCAACRRELEFLATLIETLPPRRAAHDGAAPFSKLLGRINRQERQVRTWRMAAAVLVALVGIAVIALPAYLFEPRYRAVTDPLPETSRVQIQLIFNERENGGELTRLLERYDADVVSGPADDGSFLLEFRLPPGETAANLRQRLETDAQVLQVDMPQ